MFICNLPNPQEIIDALAASDDINFKNLDENSPIAFVRLFKLGDEVVFRVIFKQSANISIKGPDQVEYGGTLLGFPELILIGPPFNLYQTVGTEDYNESLESLLLFERIDKIDPNFIMFFKRLWDIRKPEQLVAEEIFALVGKNDYLAAIEQAKKEQANQYYEAIWKLASYLHRYNLVDNKVLIDLYENIHSNNPYYQEANERLAILYTPDCFPNQHKFFCLEKQLKAAILSKNSILVGQIFHSLCGYKGQSIARELMGNTEGLIAIAAHIRMLNQQVAQLQPKQGTLNNNKQLENVDALTASASSIGIFSTARKDNDKIKQIIPETTNIPS